MGFVTTKGVTLLSWKKSEGQSSSLSGFEMLSCPDTLIYCSYTLCKFKIVPFRTGSSYGWHVEAYGSVSSHLQL